MKPIFTTLVCSVCLAILAACDAGPKSAAGFRLPDGDAGKGRETFVGLECQACHQIIDLELPPAMVAGPVTVRLGGPVTKVKTYGELVTSIINPSHKLAKGYSKEQVSKAGTSLMPIYNDVMTVQELIDLVAFLQSYYRITPPPFEYEFYGP